MLSASCRADQAHGLAGVLADQQQCRKVELPVGGARCRFPGHGAEFEARLRDVAGDPGLSVRIGRSPCARAVPVIDEPLGGRPVGAAQNSLIDLSAKAMISSNAARSAGPAVLSTCSAIGSYSVRLATRSGRSAATRNATPPP